MLEEEGGPAALAQRADPAPEALRAPERELAKDLAAPPQVVMGAEPTGAYGGDLLGDLHVVMPAVQQDEQVLRVRLERARPPALRRCPRQELLHRAPGLVH